MFEKAARTVMKVGENVIDSAKNFGNTLYNTSKEQGEIAALKVRKSVIEKTLQEYYAMIGKRYYGFMTGAEKAETFDVSDILEQMQPEFEKLEEIEKTLREKELNEKKMDAERIQKRAQETYDADKGQLDKALDMDIITQEEYDEKMAKVQKRFDHYEELRKIDLQLEMGIIDQEEYELKIGKILA